MATNNIFDKTNPRGVYAQLGKLEQTLGLPDGFCESLRQEDDWSFIIKLHAVLEAALTTVLTEKIGHTKLQPVLSRIEMSQEGSGKLAFAEALDLLESDERGFIRKLSWLRNRLFHQIQNVTFNIKADVDGSDKNQKDSFVKAFGMWGGPTENRDFQTLRQYALDHPKSLIWEGCPLILGLLMLEMDIARSEREGQTLLEHLFSEAQATGQTPDEGGTTRPVNP